MITQKNILKAVSTLNFATKNGEINWVNSVVPRGWYVDNADETVINPVYDTIFEGRSIRIFKYRYRYYADEDNYIMSSKILLCFIDYSGNILWEFPDDRSIADLYDTVRYKSENLDDFFKKFIPDTEDDPVF